MRCTACTKPLDPAWRLCPFCGAPAPRATRCANPELVWQLWNRYRRHVRDGMLPFLRSLAAAKSEALAVKVEAWRPKRYIDALATAMRQLDELGQDTRLPLEFRHALRELGGHDDHGASIAQALAPAVTEVRAAVHALIEAGDIDASVLQRVEGYLERRDWGDTFVQLGGALTGLDTALLRAVGQLFAGWIESSRSSTRQQRWEAACLELTAAGDRLIDRGWDHLARRTHDAGLALREAKELRALEVEANGCWQEVVKQQDSEDGSFEHTLSRVHALARAHPHCYPMQQLVKHAKLHAEVRAELVGHWTSRVCIGMTAVTLERAQQHFLRLLPGDGVLAFFATTVFGQGKAGLALTTSSLQWLGDDQVMHWAGYAQLRGAPITWTDEHLIIGAERIGELTAHDAEAAGRALRACIRLSLVEPGPAVCPCGAPGHWLSFGANEARCPGCGGAVHYV